MLSRAHSTASTSVIRAIADFVDRVQRRPATGVVKGSGAGDVHDPARATRGHETADHLAGEDVRPAQVRVQDLIDQLDGNLVRSLGIGHAVVGDQSAQLRQPVLAYHRPGRRSRRTAASTCANRQPRPEVAPVTSALAAEVERRDGHAAAGRSPDVVATDKGIGAAVDEHALARTCAGWTPRRASRWLRRRPGARPTFPAASGPRASMIWRMRASSGCSLASCVIGVRTRPGAIVFAGMLAPPESEWAALAARTGRAHLRRRVRHWPAVVPASGSLRALGLRR